MDEFNLNQNGQENGVNEPAAENPAPAGNPVQAENAVPNPAPAAAPIPTPAQGGGFEQNPNMGAANMGGMNGGSNPNMYGNPNMGGANMNGNANMNIPDYGTNYQANYKTVRDDGGFLWGLLGCCIPIVGLVLFLVWKNDRPNTARAAGIGALVSVGLSVAFYILSFVIGISSVMLGA